jgi:integrase/recombinase XerC
MNYEPEILSDEEVVKFLQFFEREALTEFQKFLLARNQLICLLMLDAGLRVGEVVKLRLATLHFGGATVSAIDLDSTTAEKSCTRLIPLSVNLHDAISLMHLNHWGPAGLKDSDSPLSREPGDSPLTIRQIERIVDTISVATINHHIHPHVLRHTFATRIMRKANIRIVQQLLGHTSLLSTQVYTHPNINDLQDAIHSID